MSSIQEEAIELVDEFSLFDQWMDKYEHIIEMGKELEPLAPEHKIEDNLVKGCQSQVWLVAENKGGVISYKADSDAVITKGIIAMLIRVLSNHSAEEIANASLDFIDEIGLKDHLSPNRSNGLVAMVKQMKFYALAHSVKS